jgi:hypothetical protein
MIDDHEAERSGAHHPPLDEPPFPDAGMHPDDLWASDDGPLPAEASPPAEPPPASQLERADDPGLGEAELALLEWAAQQRQAAAPDPPRPAQPPADARPEPWFDWEPTPEPPREPQPVAGTPGEEPPPPGRFLHRSAEEAIAALVAAGGPDPRDFATPRLGRRAKAIIAIALVLLFVVSALGGFVGYRLTHRAAGAATQAAGRLVEVRGGAV